MMISFGASSSLLLPLLALILHRPLFPSASASVALEIDWALPQYGVPIPPLSVAVGDSLTFSWTNYHNVYIHPSGTCDQTGAILVGGPDASPATHTFRAGDVGTVFFACDVGMHCSLGQIQVVRVTAGDAGPPEETPVEEVGGATGTPTALDSFATAKAPTDAVTVAPTVAPTNALTNATADKSDSFWPTQSFAPTNADTEVPTNAPTVAATVLPTDAVSFLPTESFLPTNADTDAPTHAPSDATSLPPTDSTPPTKSEPPTDTDDTVPLHIPGACTLAEYYPLFCSKEEASDASPEGLARYWKQGLWMPLLDPHLMLSGLYKGDAPVCTCQESTQVDDPIVATGGENVSPSGAAGGHGGILIQFLAAVLTVLLLVK